MASEDSKTTMGIAFEMERVFNARCGGRGVRQTNWGNGGALAAVP